MNVQKLINALRTLRPDAEVAVRIGDQYIDLDGVATLGELREMEPAELDDAVELTKEGNDLNGHACIISISLG